MVSVVLTIMALLIVIQALLGAIGVIARMLWVLLGLALIYLVVLQMSGG